MRDEIEQKRSDLSSDIEAIEDRVRPSRMARRRTEAIRSSWHGAREAVMGRIDETVEPAKDLAGSVADAPHHAARAAQGSPLAAGMVAFGLGMLTAALVPETTTERQVVDAVRPQLDQAKDVVVGALAEDARAVADDVRPQVEERLDGLQASAKEAATRVQDEVRG